RNHRYLSDWRAEGPLAATRIGFSASGAALGAPVDWIDLEIDFALYGLGYLVIDSHVSAAGVDGRIRVCATPVEGDRVRVFFMSNVRGTLLTIGHVQGWAVESLESSVLKIEVSTNPYSFRVIEKSTGETLLAQDGTTFSFGPELYPVMDTANLTRSADSIRADLLMQFSGRDSLPAGSPDRAQVSFSFLKP